MGTRQHQHRVAGRRGRDRRLDRRLRGRHHPRRLRRDGAREQQWAPECGGRRDAHGAAQHTRARAAAVGLRPGPAAAPNGTAAGSRTSPPANTGTRPTRRAARTPASPAASPRPTPARPPARTVEGGAQQAPQQERVGDRRARHGHGERVFAGDPGEHRFARRGMQQAQRDHAGHRRRQRDQPRRHGEDDGTFELPEHGRSIGPAQQRRGFRYEPTVSARPLVAVMPVICPPPFRSIGVTWW